MKPSASLVVSVASLVLLLVAACRPSGASRPEAAAKNSAPEALPTNRTIRLAVAGFASSTEGESARRQSALLVDLLTSQLSASTGFELVERADIDRAIREAALSLNQMHQPAAAIRSGKLLRADWLLSGSFLNAGPTNSLLAKIVDAQTGIVRDLTCVPYDGTNALPAVESIARFVESSRASVPALKERLFLALGGIQDLSINNRFPDFARNLRATLAQHYRGTRVAVLERAMVEPLLDELRLSLGGLSEGPAGKAAMQPAFVLLDGVYQSYQDTDAKVNCVLRIQMPGGRVFSFAGKEAPGAGLDEKVIAVIDRALDEPVIAATAESHRQEVLRHFKRGVTLMQTPHSGLTEEARQSKHRMRLEAIEAFQAALLLNPEQEKAKFYLAECLMDPDIGRKEQARDYYREIMATSTDASLGLRSGKALAVSYQGEDDAEAAELLGWLRKKSTNLTDQVELMELQSASFQKLASAGRMPLPSRLQFSEEWWRTRLTLAEARLQARSNDLSMTHVFRTHLFDLSHFVFRDDAESMKRHMDRLLPQLEKEFPRFKPYLVISSMRALDAVFKHEPPPELLAGYMEMLDAIERQPEAPPAPSTFYGEGLLGDLYSYCERKPLALALRIGSILETHGRRHLRTNELDEANLVLAHVHQQEQNWSEAIARLDRIGDRMVPMRTTGPWQPNYRVNGKQLADEYRRRSGALPAPVATPSPGQVFSLGPPVVKLSEPIVFACDGPQVWVASGVSFFEYARAGGQLTRVELGLTNSEAISQVVATPDKVWIATVGDGLLALDKGSRQIRRYTVAEGLMLPNLSLLRRIGDRLWIGYGHPKLASAPGGLSYVDLRNERLVGFSPTLRTNLSSTVAEGGINSTAFESVGPMRTRFEAIVPCTDDSVWLSSRSHGLVRFWFAKNEWKIEPVYGEFSSLDTNEKTLVLGCRDLPSVQGIFVGLAVFDRRKQEWRNLNKAAGLPGNSVQAVAIDGDKVWVGGRGWLALVDLGTLRVERTEQLGNLRVGSIQIDRGDLWLAAGGQLHLVPRK